MIIPGDVPHAFIRCLLDKLLFFRSFFILSWVLDDERFPQLIFIVICLLSIALYLWAWEKIADGWADWLAADTSTAASFYAKVLCKLQKAFAANSNVDLLSVFPRYSTRLATMKQQKAGWCSYFIFDVTLIHWWVSKVISTAAVGAMNATTEQTFPINHGTSELASSVGVTTIMFPLSESVWDLLGASEHDSTNLQSLSISIKLSNAIKTSQIIWQSQACPGHAVVRCSASIVAKIVSKLEDYTEYTSMQYIMEHAPVIPAPRPLGLLASEGTSYIFVIHPRPNFG